jgi:hypothetical protein
MLLQDGAFRFPSTDNTFGNNIVFMRWLDCATSGNSKALNTKKNKSFKIDKGQRTRKKKKVFFFSPFLRRTAFNLIWDHDVSTNCFAVIDIAFQCRLKSEIDFVFRKRDDIRQRARQSQCDSSLLISAPHASVMIYDFAHYLLFRKIKKESLSDEKKKLMWKYWFFFMAHWNIFSWLRRIRKNINFERNQHDERTTRK